MTSRQPSKRPALALDVNVVQDNLPQEIVPNVFIGSIHAAFNQESLHSLGVSHILNASRLPPTFPKLFTYLSIDLRDKDDANILSCIPAANIFIEAGIDAGGVLVHCFGGRSRSAAFVAAYLMSSRGWDFDQAISAIMAVRPVASINKGFEAQLRAYSQTGCDVYAAQQVLLCNRIRGLQQLRFARHDPPPKGKFKNDGNSSTHSSQSISNITGAGTGTGTGTGAVGNEMTVMTNIRGSSRPLGIGSNIAPISASGIMSSNISDSENIPTPARAESKFDESKMEILDEKQTFKVIGESSGGGSGGGSYSRPGSAAIDRKRQMRSHISSPRNTLTSDNANVNTNANANSAGNWEGVVVNTGAHIGRGITIGIPHDDKMSNITDVPSSSSRGGSGDNNAGIGRPESALAACTIATNTGVEDNTVAVYMDPKSPRCRLSRPGTTTVRVIPPLRGLERGLCCSWCGGGLFCLANVIRVPTNPPVYSTNTSPCHATGGANLGSHVSCSHMQQSSEMKSDYYRADEKTAIEDSKSIANNGDNDPGSKRYPSISMSTSSKQCKDSSDEKCIADTAHTRDEEYEEERYSGNFNVNSSISANSNSVSMAMSMPMDASPYSSGMNIQFPTTRRAASMGPRSGFRFDDVDIKSAPTMNTAAESPAPFLTNYSHGPAEDKNYNHNHNHNNSNITNSNSDPEYRSSYRGGGGANIHTSSSAMHNPVTSMQAAASNRNMDITINTNTNTNTNPQSSGTGHRLPSRVSTTSMDVEIDEDTEETPTSATYTSRSTNTDPSPSSSSTSGGGGIEGVQGQGLLRTGANARRYRPQSVEKRRWLARMSLLTAGENTAITSGGNSYSSSSDKSSNSNMNMNSASVRIQSRGDYIPDGNISNTTTYSNSTSNSNSSRMSAGVPSSGAMSMPMMRISTPKSFPFPRPYSQSKALGREGEALDVSDSTTAAGDNAGPMGTVGATRGSYGIASAHSAGSRASSSYHISNIHAHPGEFSSGTGSSGIDGDGSGVSGDPSGMSVTTTLRKMDSMEKIAQDDDEAVKFLLSIDDDGGIWSGPSSLPGSRPYSAVGASVAATAAAAAASVAAASSSYASRANYDGSVVSRSGRSTAHRHRNSFGEDEDDIIAEDISESEEEEDDSNQKYGYDYGTVHGNNNARGDDTRMDLDSPAIGVEGGDRDAVHTRDHSAHHNHNRSTHHQHQHQQQHHKHNHPLHSQILHQRRKYLYVEYLDWMEPQYTLGNVAQARGNRTSSGSGSGSGGASDGNYAEVSIMGENSADKGTIKCRHCRRPVGSWLWKPSRRQSLDGRLQAPIFRINRSVVHLADFPMDATPTSTPRPDDG